MIDGRDSHDYPMDYDNPQNQSGSKPISRTAIDKEFHILDVANYGEFMAQQGLRMGIQLFEKKKWNQPSAHKIQVGDVHDL